MRKKDILKMHGLTEEEFYKIYPTEEHYRKANGQSFKQQGGVNIPQFNPKTGPGWMLPDLALEQFKQRYGQPSIKNYGDQAFLNTHSSSGGGNKASFSMSGNLQTPVTNIQWNDSTIQGASPQIQEQYWKNKYSNNFQSGGTNSLNLWAPDFFNTPFLMNKGGSSCYECGGQHKQFGGAMSKDLEGTFPTFNYGGMDYMYGGDPSLPTISSKESLKMFKNLAKGGQPAFPGQNQQSKLDEIKNDFMSYIRNSTMDAIARDEHANMMSALFQFGGSNPYGYNPDMNNQQIFYNASMQGKERFQQDMSNFMSATQNLRNTMTPYTQTSITPIAADGIQVMTNPATGKPYSPEEYAYLKSHFEKPIEKQSTQSGIESKVQPWWQRSGYTYFPMNYEPMMKMSNKDIETMQMLAANPNTNIKEFHAKKRLFGPGVRRVDMVFGTKSKIPTVNNINDFVPSSSIDKDIHVIRDPKRELNIGSEINTTPNPNFSWNTNFQMGGWNFAGTEQAPDYRSMLFGTQPDPLIVQDNGASLVSGDPLTNYEPEHQYRVTQKFKNKWDPEATANWTLAGMSALASAFEQKDARKNMEKWKSMQGADDQFYSMPGGNRGDYDQFGNFRPNQKVPVQFAGQNFGQVGTPYTFQEGGEYYMTDDQINSIIEGGGEIEFLD